MEDTKFENIKVYITLQQSTVVYFFSRSDLEMILVDFHPAHLKFGHRDIATFLARISLRHSSRPNFGKWKLKVTSPRKFFFWGTVNFLNKWGSRVGRSPSGPCVTCVSWLLEPFIPLSLMSLWTQYSLWYFEVTERSRMIGLSARCGLPRTVAWEAKLLLKTPFCCLRSEANWLG